MGGIAFLQNCARRMQITVLCLFAVIVLIPPVNVQGQAKKKIQIDLSTAIVQVAKQNIPAVVHLDVIEKQDVANPFFPFENDPFFGQFFGNRRAPKKFKRELKGLGTGMIIDSQGNILTNHHVAGGATKIEVSLSDGRKFSAKLVGSDPKTDLAVVRITSKTPLPHVTFGDSDKMEVGEWVIAIGHPRGLDQTVTQGIISAKHRRGITEPSSYQDFLQTDAAINPGNSGGPLLNLSGEVIGVNTAIASQSGGSEGIGFAIPSNMALYVAKTLLSKGKVDRGWLGVNVQDLTPELAKGLGIQATRGALVSEVLKGGPADRAGLKRDDVIVGFQGREINDAAALRNESAVTAVGQDARVTILRQGKKRDVTVKMGNLQEAVKYSAGAIKDRFGAEVKALTPKDAEKFDLDPKQGVVISWVDPKGPLGSAGFEVGDIIVAVNGQPVAGMDGFLEMASTLKSGQRVTLMAVDSRTGNSARLQVVLR